MLKAWTYMQNLRFLAREDRGATMVEYGIMVALIAAVAIATIVILGQDVNTAFETVEGEMP